MIPLTEIPNRPPRDAGGAAVSIFSCCALLAMGVMLSRGARTDGDDRAQRAPTTSYSQRRTVVYIVAPPAPELEQAREAVLKGFDMLKPIQAFTAIVYADGKPVSLQDALVRASPTTKRSAATRLALAEARPNGEIVPALRLAAGFNADVVYLITGLGVTDAEAAPTVVRDEFPKSTKLNVVVFGTLGAAEEAALRNLAAERGGIFNNRAEAPLQPATTQPTTTPS